MSVVLFHLCTGHTRQHMALNPEEKNRTGCSGFEGCHCGVESCSQPLKSSRGRGRLDYHDLDHEGIASDLLNT